jgi:hypothetical protein
MDEAAGARDRNKHGSDRYGRPELRRIQIVTLEQLITLVQNPSQTLQLPPSLDLSQDLIRDCYADWKDSEASRKEIGRTMQYQARSGGYAIQLSNRVPGDQAGRSVDIPAHKGDDQFADFHTHPTDSDPGYVYNYWIYLPPSLPDVQSIANKHNTKKLFISFVAVSSYEIYAVLYLKGLTNSDSNRLASDEDDNQAELLNYVLRMNKMAPHDWQNFKYDEAAKQRKDTSYDAPKAIQDKLDEMIRKCSGYGSESARITAGRLFQACQDLQYGLYKGKSCLLKVNSAQATVPNPKGYTVFGTSV